jgi:hypothetical protein
MRRILFLAALLTSGSLAVLQAGVVLPPGKSLYTVSLGAVPDPDLAGKNVDVMSRIITSNSAVGPLEKLVLHNVLLLSIHDDDSAASDRNAVLILSPDEIKKLNKVSEKVGVDLLIRRR